MANEFIIRKGYKSLAASEVTGSLRITGDTYAGKFRLGNTQLYPSGDNNHIHFIGTALIGTSTTATSNPNIGTSTYPFNQIHASTFYGDGSNLTNITATSFTETDTLDSVTDRGATTTNNITVGTISSSNITVNSTITTPTDTHLSLSPSGNGHVYFGNAGNGMKLFHYSHANDGKYTTHDFNGSYYRLSTTATSGVWINDPLRVDGALDLNGAANIDGLLDVNTGTANTVAIFESTDDKAFIIIKDNDTDTHLISKDGKFYIGQDSTSYEKFNVDISNGSTNIGGNLTVNGAVYVANPLNYQFSLASNALITPSYTNAVSTPFGRSWHDTLAFQRNYTVSQETSTDNSSWTSATTTAGLFVQKDKTAHTVIASGVRSVRWTFTGVAYNVARFIHIASGYSSPAPSCTVTVEYSSDNTNWTTIHTSTGVTFSASNRYYSVEPYIGNGGRNYCRITIDKGNTDTKVVRLTGVKMLTQRLGDQGKGREDELPFLWDDNKKITLEGGATTNSNSTTIASRKFVARDSNGTGLFADNASSGLSIADNGNATFTGDVLASEMLFTTLNGHAHIDSQSSSLMIEAANIQAMGNLIPDGNGNRNLGASNRYWAELYSKGVTSNGNIIVNSNSPRLELGVSNTSTGNAEIRMFSKNNNAANAYYLKYHKDTGIDRLEFIDGSGNANIKFNNGGSASFAGNVTISNASPALNLTDTDNSSNIALSSVGGALVVNSPSDQVYQIGGTEKFRIGSNKVTALVDELELSNDFSIQSTDGNYWQRIKTIDSSTASTEVFSFDVRKGAGTDWTQLLILKQDDSAIFAGDVTVAGTLTAQEFHTEYVSASIMYESGSTKFGDTSDDNHDFTGSLGVLGNITADSTGNSRVILESGGSCVMDLLNAQSEAYLRTTTAHDLHFRTTNLNRMVIKAGGNVGIGTTTPDATLKIVDASNSSTTSLSLNDRIKFRADGVISWGSAAGHGQLNWSGNYALISGLSNRGLKFNVGGSSLALTLDTTLDATFGGDVLMPTAGQQLRIGSFTNGSSNNGEYANDDLVIGDGSISIYPHRRGDYGLNESTATSTTFRSKLNIWSDNEDHITFGGASTHMVSAWETWKIWINNDSAQNGIFKLYHTNAKTEFARLSGDGTTSFITGKFNATKELTVSSVATTNGSPTTDNISVSGYGMIGNRGSVYLTNSNTDSAASVQIGVGGVHAASTKLLINPSNSIFSTNVRVGADSTYSLGTDVARWANVYADYYYGDGSNLTNVPVASHNHAASEITSGTLDNARLDSKVFINDGGTFSTGFASDVDTLSGFIIKRVTGFTGTDHRAFTGHHNLLQIPNTSSNQHDAQIAFETGTVADGGIKFRNSTGGTWGSWYRLYHEGHKPTLAELGAAADTVVNQTDFVSAANGGTFSGNITIDGDLDLASTHKITIGPNSTWSKSLIIGNDANNSTSNAASIGTTNGNLHLDAAIGSFATYLNFYDGTNGVAFGNGQGTNVAWMGPDGDLWKGSSDNNGSKYWHAGNDGPTSGLAAQTAATATTAGSAAKLTDGGGLTTQPGTANLIHTGQINAGTTGLFATSDNSNSIITLNRHSGNYDSQLGFSSNGYLYYRKFSNSTAFTTQAWKVLAFTDSDITGEAATVTSIGNLTGHITSVNRVTSLGSFTTAELNAAISDGTINSQTLPSDFVSAANGGTFAGDITIGGSSGSTGNALSVNRGSDGAQALRIQNSGEVVTAANYLYAASSGTSLYVQNTAVFRGSIVNDGGDVTIADNLTVNGNITIGGNKYTLTVNAPTSLVTSIVNDTINVTFTASTTTNIDNYLVFSSVAGGDYGLISVIPPADFGATMSIIDDSFNAGGTQAYRVYAVKNGVYSSALTGTKSFTVGTVEPTNLSVVNLNTAFYIQYDAPSAKGRFVTAYNIYKHEHATQASLDRSSATLIYSGMNNSYMYQISGNNNDNFHKFWVETTVV